MVLGDFVASTSLGNLRRSFDPRIGENICLVCASCGELRNNRTLGTRLKPMKRIGRQRVLLAGLQADFPANGVIPKLCTESAFRVGVWCIECYARYPPKCFFVAAEA
jgi:hypothetical protein